MKTIRKLSEKLHLLGNGYVKMATYIKKHVRACFFI